MRKLRLNSTDVDQVESDNHEMIASCILAIVVNKAPTQFNQIVRMCECFSSQRYGRSWYAEMFCLFIASKFFILNDIQMNAKRTSYLFYAWISGRHLLETMIDGFSQSQSILVWIHSAKCNDFDSTVGQQRPISTKKWDWVFSGRNKIDSDDANARLLVEGKIIAIFVRRKCIKTLKIESKRTPTKTNLRFRHFERWKWKEGDRGKMDFLAPPAPIDFGHTMQSFSEKQKKREKKLHRVQSDREMMTCTRVHSLLTSSLFPPLSLNV